MSETCWKQQKTKEDFVLIAHLICLWLGGALQSKTGCDRSRHLHLWLVERRDRSRFWRPVLNLQHGLDLTDWLMFTGVICWSDISRSVDTDSIHEVWAFVWCAEPTSAAGVCVGSCWHHPLCSWNHRMRRSCSRSQMSRWTGNVSVLSFRFARCEYRSCFSWNTVSSEIRIHYAVFRHLYQRRNLCRLFGWDWKLNRFRDCTRLPVFHDSVFCNGTLKSFLFMSR